ncbi:MAG: butyrate kinase, partial [Mucinivorans sp.]
ISNFTSVSDQFAFRRQEILEAIKKAGIELASINTVVGRGGLLHPMTSGVYEVNELMLRDLKNSPIGQHASNLGGLIAHDIAQSLHNVKAYIADPVVVDELQEVARLTGIKGVERHSIFHALNQKAVAREWAKEHGTQYDKSNLIVAHMGGGISVGAHRCGEVVDVNNALDGEGPYTPERAGSMPCCNVVEMCMSGTYSRAELYQLLCGRGGLVSLLGTNQVIKALEMAKSDPWAKLVMDGMVYNIAKNIGQMAVVLCGKVDAIILTGGIAHSRKITDEISSMVDFIAPVVVYPGEDEMKALAQNALRVINGETQVKQYLGAQ